MKINLDFNVSKILKEKQKWIEKNQVLLDQKIMEDSNYFIPMKNTDLEQSVIKDLAHHKGKGYLLWNVPYAHYQYEGEDFNFSKDKNPNARPKWFEEAKKIHKKEWIDTANGKNT